MKSKPTYQELEKKIEILHKEKTEIKNDKQEEILNSITDGIYINSPNYTIEYLNEPMIKMLGSDKTGQKCYKAIYNKNKICEWCVFKKLKKNEPITYELKHPFTNNYYIIKNVLLDNGSKVASFHDICNIKENELNLQKQNSKYEALNEEYKTTNEELIIAKEKAEESEKREKKFANIVRTSPLAIAIGYANGMLGKCNTAFSELTGYTFDELKGMSWNTVLTPEKWHDIETEKLNELITTKKRVIYEKEYIRKDGKIVPVELVVTAKFRENGDLIHYFGFVYDLTERKKTEKEIQKQNNQLKEANATKDKFFSIISHDLKSPFNAILGFSKILLNKHKDYDEEKREKLIKSVNNSANNAYKLLENLLTWSRLQSGKITYTPEKLDLKTLLFETLFDLQGQADKKNIKILDTISQNEIFFADKNMIATVLRNLISNAIKFTSKNETIVITSEKQTNSNFGYPHKVGQS